MNESQALFGAPSERAAAKVRPFMVDWVQAFIRSAPFLVMASANAEGACDASPKGGLPGFVKVLSPTQLLIPDVAGNRLFQSYENFASNPHVGLIFLIPGIPSTARVNGSVEILRPGDPTFARLSLEVFDPDERAKVLQAVLVNVRESYSHCPRAIASSRLWSAEVIAGHEAASPLPPWEAGT